MTPEQRYMLDASGYLILRGALSRSEVEDARVACDSYVQAQENADAGRSELPRGFPGNGGADAVGSRMIYANGFAWRRSLAIARLGHCLLAGLSYGTSSPSAPGPSPPAKSSSVSRSRLVTCTSASTSKNN